MAANINESYGFGARQCTIKITWQFQNWNEIFLKKNREFFIIFSKHFFFIFFDFFIFASSNFFTHKIFQGVAPLAKRQKYFFFARPPQPPFAITPAPSNIPLAFHFHTPSKSLSYDSLKTKELKIVMQHKTMLQTISIQRTQWPKKI